MRRSITIKFLSYFDGCIQPQIMVAPGGTEIGLVTVKKVMDMDDGSIRVESAADVATTFIFTLN